MNLKDLVEKKIVQHFFLVVVSIYGLATKVMQCLFKSRADAATK